VPHRGLNRGRGAVVVAVIAVGEVQVVRDEVVDMVAVGDCIVPAIRAVCVRGQVSLTVVARRAARGIFLAYGEDVLVEVVSVKTVQMPVVEVSGVIFVPDGGVAAPVAVHVVVSFVEVVMGLHGPLSSVMLAEAGTPQFWLSGTLESLTEHHKANACGWTCA